VHEEGHIKVAESVAKQSSRTVKSDAMASPQAARTNLQEKLETHLNEVNKELDDRTTRYDEVTDHGRKQSQGPEHGFPGGKDVVLNCP
jgi:predicted secreted Zn-dependent protease